MNNSFNHVMHRLANYVKILRDTSAECARQCVSYERDQIYNMAEFCRGQAAAYDAAARVLEMILADERKEEQALREKVVWVHKEVE